MADRPSLLQWCKYSLHNSSDHENFNAFRPLAPANQALKAIYLIANSNHVFLLIEIVGNLLEKSLACWAIFTATVRATFL